MQGAEIEGVGGSKEALEGDKEFPEKITAFIRRHHVMTLATVGGGAAGDDQACVPWVAHAFFAWVPAKDGEGGCFVFAVNPDTRHGAEMSLRPRVAAAIALETRLVGRLQGLQIEGHVRLADGAKGELARRAYLRRFPYAAAIHLTLWILEPTLVKFTDNTLGFGKKLIWRG